MNGIWLLFYRTLITGNRSITSIHKNRRRNFLRNVLNPRSCLVKLWLISYEMLRWWQLKKYLKWWKKKDKEFEEIMEVVLSDSKMKLLITMKKMRFDLKNMWTVNIIWVISKVSLLMCCSINYLVCLDLTQYFYCQEQASIFSFWSDQMIKI